MDDVAGLITRLLGLVSEIVNASSPRLGAAGILGILLVLLLLLSQVARPTSRWTTRDLGRLAGVGRAMAIAAESGSDAAFSLGTAGVIRSTPAAARLQTLAALPILGHAAAAAARSGVPISVTSNDPIAVVLAEAVLDDAHRRTETLERAGRSSAVFVGEGRGTAGWASLRTENSGHAAFVMGDLGQESPLLVEGATSRAALSSLGTAAATQASVVFLGTAGSLIGPELYLVPADLRGGPADRAASYTTNRLLWAVVALLLLGSMLAILELGDLAGLLTAAE